DLHPRRPPASGQPCAPHHLHAGHDPGRGADLYLRGHSPGCRPRSAGAYDVSVRVDDGRGGFDTQSFVVTLTVPANSISGLKWNDLNGNGLRDAAYLNPPTSLQPIDLKEIGL